MKKLSILLLIMFVSCGPSDEEIQSRIDDALEKQRIENEKAIEEAVFQATSTTAKPVDNRLYDALFSCNMLNISGVELEDDYQSLYLDGEGEEDYYGVSIDNFQCFFRELDIAKSLVDRIYSSTYTQIHIYIY